MTRIGQFILRTILGLVLAIFVLVLAALLTFIYAWLTQNSGTLPGIITVDYLVVNDTPAFDFVPNFAGFGTAALVLGLLVGATAFLPTRRHPSVRAAGVPR